MRARRCARLITILAAVGLVADCRARTREERAAEVRHDSEQVAAAQKNQQQTAERLDKATKQYREATGEVEKAKSRLAEERNGLKDQIARDAGSTARP